MQRSCSVKGCPNKFNTSGDNSGITYHKFPKDPDYLGNWVRFCGWRDTWKPWRNDSICSAHFEEFLFDDFMDDRLLKSDETGEENVCSTPADDITLESDEFECKSNPFEMRYGEALTWEKVNCKICQSELQPGVKYLLEDVVGGNSYKDIIEETLNITVCYEIGEHLWICNTCSKFIEDLYSFVKVCRQSLSLSLNKIKENSNSALIDNEHCTAHGTNVLENHISVQQDVADMTISEPIEVESIDDSHIRNEESIQHDPVLEVSPTDNSQVSTQSDISGVPVKHDTKLQRKTHTNTPIICDVCGKMYANSRQLHVHMNWHTKRIKYACQYCDKVFYIWKYRKIHERSHINSDAFSCKECNSSFSNQRLLDCHIKVEHKGKRLKYSCQHCSYKVDKKRGLLVHVRAAHTDKRPYKCLVCSYTFSNRSNHYCHFKVHAKRGEVKDYQVLCAYCPEIFTSYSIFESHIIAVHPEHAVFV
ncbi:zinc finger and SCAN domain-containing protein 31-like isoform X2 [Armigeres subalbatus]|uniref:zinc finger and SCAN domain-containing protein 31-like isoform X2 n=1 Tax=Armigeres subalbatus TaxID=124917 RepID=UPI002ED2401A